jgi:hypothetical protein
MSEVKLSTQRWPAAAAHVRMMLLRIWRQLVAPERRYCRERHYMRGPGPKSREKQLAMKRHHEP